MTDDLIVAVIALVFGFIAMVLAIKKQHNTPTVLQTDTSELQRKVSLLERDVASLQRMLVEKQNEIDKLNERIRHLERGVGAETPSPNERRRVLLVGVGDDAMLQEDLAQLRRVQAQTAIRISRLLPVSRASLERTIERHRAAGNPVRYLHLAVHSGPSGLQFADGTADGMWLSQQLAGVEIAMLAGCTSDSVADLLRVVPAVVSMREDVENREASIFAGAFWLAVGQGLDANEAFERALQRAPANVGEFVELHL
jgi:uncharacterized coiled-coil protein SlyX